MREVIYSNIVKYKLEHLKMYLSEMMGEEKSAETLTEMLSALADLSEFPRMGKSVRDEYGIDCDYFVLYLKKNYFIYRFSDARIDVLEIFDEREDFIFQLFGISGRTQESIDFWGE